MATPPSFGSQVYWDERFTSNPQPFEWLEGPNILDAHIVAALKKCPDEKPSILHIGCGTSLLSFHLRSHVEDPKQITNLDYSPVAIAVGKSRECEIFEDDGKIREEPGSDHQENDTISRIKARANSVSAASQLTPTTKSKSELYMHWRTADLLSPQSLLSACKPSTYSIVVDKSVSDSISCGNDISVPLPYPFTIPTSAPPSASPLDSPEPLHPLHILAIHLALVTKPGGHWIALSYSSDRFPFLRARHADEADSDDIEAIPAEHLEHGLPDPGLLWRLESVHGIEITETSGDGVAHRPEVKHFVYVLVRTDVKLAVRDYWRQSLGIAG